MTESQNVMEGSAAINRGGETIIPGEIDAALLRHPAVAEAAAFAIPHAHLGEDVAAAVVLRPGMQATTMELRRFLQRELASFKIPRHIHTLDALPQGTPEQIQRRLSKALGTQAHEPAAPSKSPTDLKTDLLSLWCRLLRSDALTIDDDFFESGGDSLLATEMLLEVERLVGHPVPEAMLFEAATIRQIVSQIAAQPEELGESCVHLIAGGDRRPLFFFHGDLTNGASQIRRLGSLLRDQPIVAIDPHGLRGEPIPLSFEEMAADRLPLILQRQASGPFLVGGKCNGGMVAFETARLLIAAGHKVDMVMMVDPPTVCARPIMRMILRLMRHTASPLRLAWTFEKMAKLERTLDRSPMHSLVRKALVRTCRLSPKQTLPRAYSRLISGDYFASPRSALWKAYTIAMSRYLPAPLDVPVVFYAASHTGRAWGRISSDVEVIEVPGGHNHCLTIGAETLVTHLRQRIDTCCDGTIQPH
jgi:oxalate---CoA ligase